MNSISAARRRAGRRAARLGRKITRSPQSNRHALVGPADLWALKRRFQFEFLTAHGLRPEHRLLDIGCGTLRGGIPLIEYLEAGHYAGIEAREKVLDEGRKELAEASLEHKRPLLIHAADPAAVAPALENSFDFAWAFSVLIHMPDEVVNGYLGLISGALTQSGRFYANVLLGDGPEGEWQGFPVVSRPFEAYDGWAASHGLAVDELGKLDTLGHSARVGGRGIMLCFTAAPAPRD